MKVWVRIVLIVLLTLTIVACALTPRPHPTPGNNNVDPTTLNGHENDGKRDLDACTEQCDGSNGADRTDEGIDDTAVVPDIEIKDDLHER